MNFSNTCEFFLSAEQLLPMLVIYSICKCQESCLYGDSNLTHYKTSLSEIISLNKHVT